MSGAYTVEWWQEVMVEAVETATRHEAFGLGPTDASLLAARLENRKIVHLRDA